MLKKIGKILGIIFIILVVGLGILVYRLSGMANRIENEGTKIAKVDLAKVADGEYTGSFGDFVVSAKVKVTVKGHRIVNITMLKQDCGPGYEALGTIGRILKAQSPKVDAVTGASSSSRAIMIAVSRALQQGTR